MPIRKDRAHLYPGGSPRSLEWRTLRAAILDRAADRCEGTPTFPACRAVNGEPHPDTGSRVVLTIAHMDSDLVDHSPANLRALCQRCHLAWDLAARVREAQRTRDRSKGQEALPLEEAPARKS